jgi:formiminoglutamase
MTTTPTPPALRPVNVPLPATAEDDPRLGHLLGRALAAGAAPLVAIVGFPSEEGVRRNGGRPGAAAAPAEIRRALYRFTPDPRRHERLGALLARTADLGDVAVTGDLERDQEALGGAVAAALAGGAFVVVIGGGHEAAYGHFLGYAALGRPVSLLNFDAHADVRPLKDGRGHSGSPFRQALSHPSGLARRYEVAGLLPQSVARAHLEFVERHGGAVFADALAAEDLPGIFARGGVPGATLVASFDVDAVDAAFAPGVSAPAAGGLSAALWLRAAYLAGRCPHTSSCDVVEVNPAHDRDGQTARLAAATVYQILCGLSDRDPGEDCK